jgi:hypothetical protein
MATKQDLRAALQLLKLEVQDESKEMKLFLTTQRPHEYRG